MSIVGQILYRLGSNAHQLAQLLTRLYPEVSQFIEDIHFKDENSPGQYYAKAILSHQNYLKTGKDGKETIEAYEKVSHSHIKIFVITGDIPNTVIIIV